MASNDSSLDINGSGGGGSGGGSHGYLGFSSDKSVRSSNVSPREYDQIKPQHYDAIYEQNTLRQQMEFYRNQTNQLEMILQEKQRVELEFDNLKKDDINVRALVEQYKELKLKYCSNRAENEKLSKEMELCKKLCDKLSDDLKTSSNEKNDLYLQFNLLIEKGKKSQKLLEKTRIEKKDLENTLKERETQIIQVSSELEAHKHELTIIHSERDTVLKENQKFAEENTMTLSQNKLLEKENKHLSYENECLKERIEAAYAKIDSLTKKMEYFKNRPEFNSVSNEFGGNSDFSDGKNKYNSDSQQAELDLQAANQEIEKLKKALDKATSEVSKAAQEINEAKGRRDWAISSRERIVGERDSIKTLCDELRKERDKAVSDLLAAFRDIEDIKKQKDEACKEIELLREQFESQQSTNPSDINYNCESESLKKVDTELIEIDMSEYSVNDDDLGLILHDGRDDMQNVKNGNVTVVSVSKDSVFSDKLQKNDVILQVNNLDCSKIPKRIILDEIRASSNRCTMLVKRQRSVKRQVYTTQLTLDSNRNHGLTLQSGVYISKIANGSPAAINEHLAIGDRILSINNHSVENMSTSNEAMSYLDDNRSAMITLIGLKQVLIQNNKLKSKSSNTSTQTDDNLNRSLDLEGNRHFVPTTNPYIDNPMSVSPVSTPAKSTSLLTGMLQKFRGKINHKSNEADAIAALDSVLIDDSNVPTKDGVIKRSKKKSKDSISSKDIAKSMGTWPKANIIAYDNNIGTIIHPRRKKERPPLSAFTETMSEKNKFDLNLGEDYFNPNRITNHNQTLKTQAPPTMSNRNTNRNSNPVSYLNPSPPPNYFNRHSLYDYIDNKSGPFSTSSGISTTLSRFTKLNEYDHNHHRISLNITPTDNNAMYNISKSQNASLFKNPTSQQQKQNSVDYMLRSQNSIESFLVPKTTMPIEFTSKLPSSKDQLDFMMQHHHNTMMKNASKYPSDSESLGPDLMHPGLHGSNSITSPPRVYSPKSVGIFPQYPPPAHSHYHPPTRLSSPYTLPGSQTGDHLGLGLNERCGFESYTPPYHSHGTSIDYPIGIERIPMTRDRDDILLGYPNGHFRYEGGTFPKKKENPRLRIPSNQSVTSRGSGVKNSTGSIELHGSERGSPMPIYKVEVLSHGLNTNKINSMPDYVYGQKPNPGDLRRVTIDKSNDPLGITIRCNKNGGGIFVQTVTENSIASQVGLQVGDQLLEICGINMRAATYEGASRVLCQCGNPITMLVQYSPEKYDGEIEQSSDDQSVSHSGSPTPRNSPRPTRTHLLNSTSNKNAITHTLPKNLTIPSKFQTQEFNEKIDKKSDSAGTFNRNSMFEEEPRVLFIETNKSPNLGIQLVGGNAFGIYVDNVKENNFAYNAGLRVGDQILEYNGSDLRRATAEHAAYELAKPADDKVTVVVQHNYKKYSQIRDLPGGDSFYIRVGFDRTGDVGESELRFVKDEVLYVDNTIFRPGQWRAWKLDESGHLLKCGIISSQLKVEEDLRLHGDISDGDATTRRGSTSARRSFFRRKKHHRSSSRDSKELASFSNTQLSWPSDSGMLSDEGTIQSYQKVERLDYPARRPVLVLGPLANWVVDKLTNDFASQFKCCQVTPMNCEQEAIENMIKSNFIIDYRRHGSIIEVTTVKAIKEVCDTNRHCILDISLTAVERLQRLQIFPIVLLLRFKSAKQIKEIKDSRFANDKISAKAAKEMYEHSLKLLTEYKHLISDAIPAGVNITHICTQIKDAVEKEQKKIIWVASPSM